MLILVAGFKITLRALYPVGAQLHKRHGLTFLVFRPLYEKSPSFKLKEVFVSKHCVDDNAMETASKEQSSQRGTVIQSS